MNSFNSGVCGFGEDISPTRLPNLSGMHVDDTIGGALGEAHFVGDDDHRHPASRQIFHNPQHLAGQFRVERRCYFVEQH